MTPEGTGRQVWVVQTLALSMSIPVYVLVAFVALGLTDAKAAGPNPHDLLVWILGGACLALVLASLAVAPRVSPGARRGDLPPAARFRSRSLAAVALAETVALLGLVGAFLLGEPKAAVIPALAALLVIVTHVVPNGLRYWRALERTDDEIPAFEPE